MLETQQLRVLTPADVPLLVDLLDEEPDVNLFVRHRVEVTQLDPALMGGRVWGWFDGDELVSACHVGANVVPVAATDDALRAFADRLATSAVRPASIVGEQEPVLALWERLEPVWGPARSPRPEQPFLVLDGPPQVEPDPRLRRVAIDEVDTVYPASVAMFREEVGVDPEVQGGGQYRARVAHLVAQGLAFAIIEHGRVLFKAEVGAHSPHGCQLQGVYVPPGLRGQGLAAPALAGVVELARAQVAPVVSLYVNDHNVAARRVYDRVGFEQVATFASILL
ncbi:MAG: GNAT family N-acetyltransferase [Aeromicrobium erythreum]